MRSPYPAALAGAWEWFSGTIRDRRTQRQDFQGRTASAVPAPPGAAGWARACEEKGGLSSPLFSAMLSCLDTHPAY
jgi:hypothetical protein